MENNNPNNSIHDSVLKAIESGKIAMRPKWHFVLRTAMLVAGTVLVALTVIYLASFIVFILRQTGLLFIPGFGLRGIQEFISSAPWLLIIIAIIFIVLLQILIKKYSFSYGRPFLYTAIGIIVLAIIGGYLLEMTPLHKGLFNQAENQRLPFAGGLYRQFGEHHSDNLVIGRVTTIASDGYIIIERDGANVTIVVTPNTNIPPGTTVTIGDVIVVLGTRKNNEVIATDINKVTGKPPMIREGSPRAIPLPQ